MRAANRAGTCREKKVCAGIRSGWMVEQQEEREKKKKERQRRLIFKVKPITDYQ